MRTLWRITREAFQSLDGEGARLNGGRWNSEGIAVVYLSSTESLAALEYLVHIDITEAPTDLVSLEIEVPVEASVLDVDPATLPPNWARTPDHPACSEVGNTWATDGKSLLLRVPSALISSENNYLLNPGHPEAEAVKIVRVRPFSFDPRLVM